MINVKLICTGTLKESYLRDAYAEYAKRLGGMCRFETVELKEHKLGDSPSESEITAALEDEGKKILSIFASSPRAYKIALCIEGKQLSSEDFAKRLEDVTQMSSEIFLVIGSSYGLSQSVKNACDMRLSVSKMTFPHQLMRIILLESVYRAFSITKGTKYHK